MKGAPVRSGLLWYLEGFTDDTPLLRRVPILSLPFAIGRRPGLGLTLASNLVSQRHAEIFAASDGLKLRDLGSTNGTFINQEPVSGEAPVREGDILHFAQFEFRLGQADAESATRMLEKTVAVETLLRQQQVERSRRFKDLLDRAAVVSVFQPVVELSGTRLLGYEVLGRSQMEGLPSSPPELFEAAITLGAEARLSRLFRDSCVEDCLSLPGRLRFFMNTHPAEVGTPELEQSLRDLRLRAPELEVTIEIHEGAVTDPPTMQRLRALLEELGMGLAYDDFGAGQARLRELAEAPPDYLKFDLGMIRGVDQAPRARKKVLESLVAMAADLGIATVAEGLETDGEATTCRELGFRYGQGFLFGTPVPARAIHN